MLICCITFTDAWPFGAMEITIHPIWQAFLTKLYQRYIQCNKYRCLLQLVTVGCVCHMNLQFSNAVTI